MSSDILSKLNSARTDLLDLGLRNPLINYRTRVRKIDVVDELATEIYRILVTEGKSMTFIPNVAKSGDAEESVELDYLDQSDPDWEAVFAEPGDRDENGLAKRHIDTKLQTRFAPNSLHARLLSLHNDAQTYIEEQGVNILFLALGFLHWYEAESSNDEHRAPILLVPVALSRTSIRERYHLSYTGEDIGTNLSLYEKLRREFSIRLPELNPDEELDIGSYFSSVARNIKGQPRWKVNADEIVLGFFSFGKFLMYKDLAAEAWPEKDGVSDNPLLTSILGEGFRDTDAVAADDTNIDSIISPKDVHQVLDADSSQLLAILHVNAGRNMVIQGPPGTGKSQTIANVIAESIGHGKKVLFVSEKMAALEVVKRRLDRVGLGDAVLELHSQKTRKTTVLSELDRTLHLGKPRVQSSQDDIEVLTNLRDRLNAYCEAANTPILSTRITPVAAIGRYTALGKDASSLPRLDFSGMRSWTDATFKQNRLRIEELQRRLSAMTLPQLNPFWGTKRTVLLPSDERRLRELLNEAKVQTEHVRSVSTQLAQDIELQAPDNEADAVIICRAAIRASESPRLEGVRLNSAEWQARRDDLKRLIEAGTKCADLHARFDDQLIPDAWNEDLLVERQSFVTYGKKWWRFLSGDYRRAKARLAGLCKSPLPADSDQCVAVIDAVHEERRQREVYRQLESIGSILFGAQWQGPASDWQVLARLVEWVTNLYRDIGDGQLPVGIIRFLEGAPKLSDLKDRAEAVMAALASQRSRIGELAVDLDMQDVSLAHGEDRAQPLVLMPFPLQLKQLSAWIERFEELTAIVGYNVVAAEFKSLGLGFVLPLAESWDGAKTDLARAFDAAWYGGLVEAAYAERPALGQFNREGHEYTIENFRKLDCFLFHHNRLRLAQQHWSQLPNLEQGGELHVIKREINKQKRHLPIRRLMAEAGRAVQAMKPVFMMSPMSIANFLPPGAMHFDLVIFDEASQVKPVDAFGAFLRGKQAVVVGDSKQLPPTSFFDTLIEGSDDAEEQTNLTADIESVLGLFLAKGAPECMLHWHYRSRHDSLITVSNHEFYKNRLMVFPSPGANPVAKGLVFYHLPGTHYDRGKSSANPEEAKAVAQAVMEHARLNPELSLGVAAFSMSQRDALLAQLELLRHRDSSCEEFFNLHPEEPFFVKNLENVQGDERDVILISIGYGKTKEGYLSMNFGPLNRQGGERRLNVLITRARQTCQVYGNFTAEDMDPERCNSEGVRALRSFLAYAKDRVIDSLKPGGQESESVFEEQVAQGLQDLGYKIQLQVGSAGFRVDIGIVDESRPGRYLLGIECDGASYHSARCARDRDRLRQEVLEGLGWRIHRIWSSDWFRNPDLELIRTVESIEKAKVYWAGIDAGTKTENKPRRSGGTTVERDDETRQDCTAVESVPYTVSKITVHLGGRPLHLLKPGELAQYVHQVAQYSMNSLPGRQLSTQFSSTAYHNPSSTDKP